MIQVSDKKEMNRQLLNLVQLNSIETKVSITIHALIADLDHSHETEELSPCKLCGVIINNIQGLSSHYKTAHSNNL